MLNMQHYNLSCGGINDARDHVERDKHKAANKNQDSKFRHFHCN